MGFSKTADNQPGKVFEVIQQATEALSQLQQAVRIFNSKIGENYEYRGDEISKELVGPFVAIMATLGIKGSAAHSLLRLFVKTEGTEIGDPWYLKLKSFMFFALGSRLLPAQGAYLSSSDYNEPYQKLAETRRKLEIKYNAADTASSELDAIANQMGEVDKKIDELFGRLNTSPKELPLVLATVGLKSSISQSILEVYLGFFDSLKKLVKASAEKSDDSLVLQIPVVHGSGKAELRLVSLDSPRLFAENVDQAAFLKTFSELQETLQGIAANLFYQEGSPTRDPATHRALIRELEELEQTMMRTLTPDPIIREILSSSGNMSDKDRFLSLTQPVEVPGGPRDGQKTIFPFLHFSTSERNTLGENSDALTKVISLYLNATPEDIGIFDKRIAETLVKMTQARKPLEFLQQIRKLIVEKKWAKAAGILNEKVDQIVTKSEEAAELYQIVTLHILNALGHDDKLRRFFKGSIRSIPDLTMVSKETHPKLASHLQSQFIPNIIAGLAYTLDDFYGHTELKEDLIQVISRFLAAYEDPDKLRGNEGSEVLDSVLFYGTYGTGKSFLAQCLANHFRMGFVKIDVSTLISEMNKDGGGDAMSAIMKEINTQFDRAVQESKNRPVMLFLDECDGMSRERSGAGQMAHLLTEYILLKWDYLRKRFPGILFTGATNHIQDMDGGMLRDGRFDLHAELKKPTLEEHVETFKGILELETESEFSEDDILMLAKASENMTHLSVKKAIRTVTRFTEGAITAGMIRKSIIFRKKYRPTDFEQANAEKK